MTKIAVDMYNIVGGMFFSFFLCIAPLMRGGNWIGFGLIRNVQMNLKIRFTLKNYAGICNFET